MYGTDLLWWEFLIGALIVAALGAAFLSFLGEMADRLIGVFKRRSVFFWAWLLPAVWLCLIGVTFLIAG